MFKGGLNGESENHQGPPSKQPRSEQRLGWDTGHGFDFPFYPSLLSKKILKKSKLGLQEGRI